MLSLGFDDISTYSGFDLHIQGKQYLVGGMKPHPLELRQRIVAAVDQQEHTIEEVAALFGVSERYVYQLLKLRRETGDLSPLPHGGGAVPKLDEARLLELARLVAEFPDATLDELRDSLTTLINVNHLTNYSCSSRREHRSVRELRLT